MHVGLDLSNSDYNLLELSRKLLVEMGHTPGRIRLVQPAGTFTNLARARKPGWLLTISKSRDVQAFATSIGFADSKKEGKLGDAIRLIKRHGRIGAARLWITKYEKQSGDWVRKE